MERRFIETKIFKITRHAAPTQLDTAERGTLCHVSSPNNPNSFYVQMSGNSDKPFWIELDAKNIDDAESETMLIVYGG